MYSLSQWGLVKNWELNNQFQLEGLAQNIFGSQADPRAWYSNQPFFVSPHELKMPTTGVTGLRNGSQADYVYLSYIWYNLQLILNDSNGDYSYQFPIDWAYANGFVKDHGIAGLAASRHSDHVADQGSSGACSKTEPGRPVARDQAGSRTAPQLSLLVTPEWNGTVWTGVDPATRAAIANGITQLLAATS